MGNVSGSKKKRKTKNENEIYLKIVERSNLSLLTHGLLLGTFFFSFVSWYLILILQLRATTVTCVIIIVVSSAILFDLLPIYYDTLTRIKTISHVHQLVIDLFEIIYRFHI